jgi:hypothetical protein
MKGLGGGRGNMIGKCGLTVEECLRWALSEPVSVHVVGLLSMEQLKEAVRIGRAFKPLTAEERAGLLARTREEAGDGRYELFKSTKMFDSRHHRELHGFRPDLVG